MRVLLGVSFAAAALCLSACGSGSSKQELAPPPKVTNFALQSKFMGRQLYEVLVAKAGRCSSSSTVTVRRRATRSARRS
jgi:hypothetical protein